MILNLLLCLILLSTACQYCFIFLCKHSLLIKPLRFKYRLRTAITFFFTITIECLINCIRYIFLVLLQVLQDTCCLIKTSIKSNKYYALTHKKSGIDSVLTQNLKYVLIILNFRLFELKTIFKSNLILFYGSCMAFVRNILAL